MSDTDVQQAQQTQQAMQIQQAQGTRIVNGVQTGLLLLSSDTAAPLSMAEGLADLKWFLRAIMAGQIAVDVDPKKTAGVAATGSPQPPAANGAGAGAEE